MICLGDLVSKEGIRVDPSEIKEMKSCTRPTLVIEIRVFV